MYKIYKITNKINQKSYIGFTSKTLKQRLNKHRKDAQYMNRDTILCQAIRKYGIESFEIELLHESESLEDTLQIMENKFIIEHETHCSTGKGYNMTMGGEGTIGHKHNETTRKLMSRSHTGMKHLESTKNKLSKLRLGDKNPNFGKTFSDETKKKISEKVSGGRNGRAKEFLVIEPSGTSVLINDRKLYCEKNNLNYWSVCSATSRGTTYQGYKFMGIQISPLNNNSGPFNFPKTLSTTIPASLNIINAVSMDSFQ
jgi:group I intron endonuclease